MPKESHVHGLFASGIRALPTRDAPLAGRRRAAEKRPNSQEGMNGVEAFCHRDIRSRRSPCLGRKRVDTRAACVFPRFFDRRKESPFAEPMGSGTLRSCVVGTVWVPMDELRVLSGRALARRGQNEPPVMPESTPCRSFPQSYNEVCLGSRRNVGLTTAS